MSNDENKQIIQSNNKVRTYQLAEIGKMADYLAESKLCGIKTKAEAFVILMIAENEGINPIQASLDYNIINGIPTIKSSAALRRFLEAGGKVEYEVYTDTECTVKASHPKYGSIKITWTIDKASKIVDYYDRTTGKPHYLTDKTNWKNYPRDMLKNRAVSEALRTIFPTGMKNLYTSEEAADFSKNENIIEVEALSGVNNDIDNSNYNLDEIIDDSEQYNIIPKGSNKGKKWTDLDITDLVKAKQYYTEKAPNETYLKIITDVLNEKLSICTIGISKDEKWEELSTEKLEQYYKYYKNGKLIDYAEEYASFIENILLARQQENKAIEADTNNVEVSEDEDPFSEANDDNWDKMLNEQENKNNVPNQIDYEDDGFNLEN